MKMKMRKCVACTAHLRINISSLYGYLDSIVISPEPFYLSFARSRPPDKQMTESVPGGATIWGCRHLPQNRDVFMVQGGAGALFLYKYSYPEQRRVKDKDGQDLGVAGTVELLSNKNVSTQPVGCFDWHLDKEGLCVMGSYDQCIRVGIVTKLNKV